MSYQEIADTDLSQRPSGKTATSNDNEIIKRQRGITTSAASAAQKGNLELAMETLELGLEQYPDNVYFLGQLGMLYRRAGHFEDARDCLEKSLALKPSDIRTVTSLAGVYADLGKYVDAEKMLNRARKLDPRDQFVVVSLARLLGEQGRYAEATDLLQKSGGLEAGNKYVIASFGVVQAVLGEQKQAREVLEKGHQLHPRDPYIINLLGILRGEMGDNEAAEELLNHGMNIDKRNRHIAASLATVYARQKKYHEAECAALDGLRYNAADTVLLNILGNVYAQIGDYARAEEALLRGRAIDPNNIAITTTLGHAYLKATNYERYNALIADTAARGERDVSYLYLTAKGALLQGKRAEAAAAARKLFELRGIDAQTAILYLACSDDAQANFTTTFGEAGVADLKARAAEIVANPALIDLYDPKLHASDMLRYIGKALSDREAAKVSERRIVRAASFLLATLIIGATGLHFSGAPAESMAAANFTGAPMNVWLTLVMALCCCTPDVPQSRRIMLALRGNR